jgi:uncharacterized caspase-like protein
VRYTEMSSFRYPSLTGAKHDATRVSAALTGAGFQTETVLDPTRVGDLPIAHPLADFAVLYTTGHGIEVDGVAYLIPNDIRSAIPRARSTQGLTV